MAVISMLLLYTAVSMVSACVPPACVYVTQEPEMKWDLDNPWLITIIAVSCLLFLAIIFILIWFCCYCCYRDNVAMAPSVVRRIVRVKHPVVKEKVAYKPPRVLHVMAPPPPPPPPPPPEKIVVVPAACPEPPRSLLLTVSEGLHASSSYGPDMTTRVDKPLTFTLTPQPDGVRHSGLRVHDHMSTISGQVDCACRHTGCDCYYD